MMTCHSCLSTPHHPRCVVLRESAGADTVESLGAELDATTGDEPGYHAETIRMWIDGRLLWSQSAMRAIWTENGREVPELEERVIAFVTRERARRAQEPACPTEPQQIQSDDGCVAMRRERDSALAQLRVMREAVFVYLTAVQEFAKGPSDERRNQLREAGELLARAIAASKEVGT